jgi:hypothetical protein
MAWIAHALLFSWFMLYDDEGYILLTLRNQIAHGALYDVVYTQYGPVFYALLGGLSRIFDFEWTHAAGRWFTLCNWTGAAALCGLAVWRANRYGAAALLVMTGVFAMLWIMIHEPIHPGGLICLLVALTAVLGAEAAGVEKPLRFAIIVGALGACVALIKINVGAFLVISGALWLTTGQTGRLRHIGLATALLLAITLPFGLMRPLMDHHWVPTFAISNALAGAAIVLVASQTIDRRESPLHLLGFVCSGGVVTLAVVAWCLSQGTTLAGLWEGVVAGPLRHPGVYSFRVIWAPLVVPVALASLVAVAAWVMRPRSPVVLHTVAALRLLTTIGMIVALMNNATVSQSGLALSYGVSLAGLFAIPLRPGESIREERSRLWIALLFVPQSLQAFPIAGSQLNWGTFLWAPLSVLGTCDALSFWGARMPNFVKRASTLVCVCIAVAISGSQLVELGRVGKARIENGTALGLPGAERLMLPTAVASMVHIISTNARTSSSVLFSLPGAFSYNLWSSVPTPSLRNVTHWFSLLSESEQQSIIHAMDAEPHSAFVLQGPLLKGLFDSNFRVQGPLVSYLRINYYEVLKFDAASFWVRKGRLVPVFGVLTSESPTTSGRIGVNLPAYERPISHLEVYYSASIAPTESPASPETSRNFRIQDIDHNGLPIGEATPVIWPLPPGGQRRLTFDWPASARQVGWIFRLPSDDGSTVGFARFAEVPPVESKSAPASNQQ